MLADEVFDHTRTGGQQAGGYGIPAARRNVRRPVGYDKNAGAIPIKFEDRRQHSVVR